MSLGPLCKSVEKRVIGKLYMLRKMRKHLTYIFDYSGFLLLACNKDKKMDLQIIQNDALHFCDNTRRNDSVHLSLRYEIRMKYNKNIVAG